MRPSQISSEKDFVVEARREDLRDRRWRRYRSMIWALASLAIAFGAQPHLAAPLQLLRSVFRATAAPRTAELIAPKSSARSYGRPLGPRRIRVDVELASRRDLSLAIYINCTELTNTS